MLPWNLPAPRRLPHFAADIGHQLADFQTRPLDVMQQGGGEGAVRARTIQGHHPRRGGKRHQYPRGGPGRRQATPRHRAAALPPEPCAERVVAAGVHHDDGDRCGVVELFQQPIHVQRLVSQVALRGGVCTDGKQPVVPAHLQRVPGVEHGGCLRAPGALAQAADRRLQCRTVGINDRIHLEPQPRQRACDRARVVGRVRQGRHELVGGHAHHQRDPRPGHRLCLRCGAESGEYQDGVGNGACSTANDRGGETKHLARDIPN